MEVLPSHDRVIVEERLGSAARAFLVAAAGRGRLRLVGELDIAGVPALRALLADLHGDIDIDCSGLTFIDCSGLRVLQETRNACEAAGVRLCLIAPSRCVTRLLGLAGLDGLFEVRDGPSS